MSTYRRCFLPGATYFFTIVTANRRPIMTSACARALLHNAFHAAIEKHPFSIEAICLLPDHLHCIWTMPENDCNYSLRWQFIKAHFSRRYPTELLQPISTVSQVKRREAGLWQRRFWEHLIRDERDYDAHVNYIHYNPVKHGLATSPVD